METHFLYSLSLSIVGESAAYYSGEALAEDQDVEADHEKHEDAESAGEVKIAIGVFGVREEDDVQQNQERGDVLRNVQTEETCSPLLADVVEDREELADVQVGQRLQDDRQNVQERNELVDAPVADQQDVEDGQDPR